MSEAKHTHGPWQVVVTEHPHHLGGTHIERRIFTVWEHPQLKGPWPVVNMSVGIGKQEGGKPVSFCSIDEADARLIAAAPDLLEALLDVSKQARHSDYDWPVELARAVDAAISKATGAQP